MALQGTLDTFALADLIRLLATTTKTGELAIDGDRGTGRLWFVAGELVGGEPASDGDAQEALFELLRFTEGEFHFHSDVEAPSAADPADAVELLAAAEQRLEEWGPIEALVPSGAVSLALAAELDRDEVLVTRETWAQLLIVAPGTTAGAFGDALGLTEVPAATLVRDLVEAGLVTVGPEVESVEAPTEIVEDDHTVEVEAVEVHDDASEPLEAESAEAQEDEPIEAVEDYRDEDHDLEDHDDEAHDVEAHDVEAHDVEAFEDEALEDELDAATEDVEDDDAWTSSDLITAAPVDAADLLSDLVEPLPGVNGSSLYRSPAPDLAALVADELPETDPEVADPDELPSLDETWHGPSDEVLPSLDGADLFAAGDDLPSLEDASLPSLDEDWAPVDDSALAALDLLPAIAPERLAPSARVDAGGDLAVDLDSHLGGRVSDHSYLGTSGAPETVLPEPLPVAAPADDSEPVARGTSSGLAATEAEPEPAAEAESEPEGRIPGWAGRDTREEELAMQLDALSPAAARAVASAASTDGGGVTESDAGRRVLRRIISSGRG